MPTKPATSSLEQCSPAQLKTLLDLGTRATSEGDALVRGAEEAGDLAGLLTELCAGRAESGALLLDTVGDPATPIDVLRGIKELANSWSTGRPRRTIASRPPSSTTPPSRPPRRATACPSPGPARRACGPVRRAGRRPRGCTPLGTVFHEALAIDLR